ncbi:unnamed protein product [Protopolystoma xenopodis]|uniref:Uncharacterized protein n=1 Tax=Protopolystoma xenopodis TaxID=117903 RepID=A0A3S5FEB4_9PLAT|nr:unnamed protein product [Protopolystoma xenopodis]
MRSSRPDERCSYRNSFGQPTIPGGISSANISDGSHTGGAEGILIACLLPAFIRRLVRCRRELVAQENISLFADIRQLLNYLRETHGSTFRRSLLSALLCIIYRRMAAKPSATCHQQARNRTITEKLSCFLDWVAQLQAPVRPSCTVIEHAPPILHECKFSFYLQLGVALLVGMS